MSDNISCNVCRSPGNLDATTETAQVRSNIRVFENEFFTVWRCKNCGSLHSKEDVDLDHYYAHYSVHAQELDYFTRRIHARCIRTLRKLGLEPHQSILDYGCGNGVLIQLLRERGFTDVTGYDPYVERFADREILNRRYHAVISSEVIEHVSEPRDWMRRISDLSEARGLVAIGTPDASALDLDNVDRYRYHLHQPYHRHILSRSALRDLGASCGLTPVYFSSRNWDSIWPAASERFFAEYVQATGGCLDVVVEPARWGTILRSFRLMFFALYGYFFPLNGEMLTVFRKTS